MRGGRGTTLRTIISLFTVPLRLYFILGKLAGVTTLVTSTLLTNGEREQNMGDLSSTLHTTACTHAYTTACEKV